VFLYNSAHSQRHNYVPFVDSLFCKIEKVILKDFNKNDSIKNIIIERTMIYARENKTTPDSISFKGIDDDFEFICADLSVIVEPGITFFMKEVCKGNSSYNIIDFFKGERKYTFKYLRFFNYIDKQNKLPPNLGFIMRQYLIKENNLKMYIEYTLEVRDDIILIIDRKVVGPDSALD